MTNKGYFRSKGERKKTELRFNENIFQEKELSRVKNNNLRKLTCLFQTYTHTVSEKISQK